MAVSIKRGTIKALGFDLDAAIADYKAAMEAHALTVGVAAPRADPLVEQIVKSGGVYEVLPRTIAAAQYQSDGSVVAVVDGEPSTVAADDPDLASWVSQGNVIAPLPQPSARTVSFTSDTDRATLISHLQNDTLAQLETYARALINADAVVDLASAKTFAKRVETALVFLLKAIALDARR